MKVIFRLLLFLTIFLSGCGKIEMNDASIPLGIGTDYKDGKIIISAQLAKPSSQETSGGQTPQFQVITASGKTFSEAVRNTSFSLSTIPLWSHTQVSVLGEGLAKHDIRSLVDFLVRNRFARKNNQMVVTHNVTPEEILNVNPILENYTSISIKNLVKIQESQLGIYTPVDTTELLQRLASPGIEPVAPMITIRKNGKEKALLLDGTAVFKGTRMIGRLNEMESRGYRLMSPKMLQGGLFLIPSPLGDKQWITIELSRSQAKITPQIQGQHIKMKIIINAEGNLYEQSGSQNLFSPEIFKQIEKATAQEMAQQISLCIRKAQTLNSDILGWGQMIYRSDAEIWSNFEPEWNQVFPATPYDIEVNFSLRRSYLTDKSLVVR